MTALRNISLILFFLIPGISKSQVDTVKQEVYYQQRESQALKEIYYVKKNNPSILHGPYVSFYHDGKKKVEGYYKEGEPFGIWKFYYENGRLKKSADRENAQNGNWNFFYEDGSIHMQGTFINNVREGDWKFFYEDGTIKSTGAFKNGEKDGLWKYFSEDGKLRSESEYKSGVGKFQEFYESGRLKREGYIINGKSDSLWKEFYESGELKAIGEERSGYKTGIWKHYHKNGELQATGSYNKGMQLGTWKYYNRQGVLESEGAHKDGFKSGLWRSYSINGATIAEGDYVDGVGPYKEYYEGSGALKVDGFIRLGQNDSVWKFYSPKGELQRLCRFKENIGECQGFYPDGSVQMEGTMRGNKEIGTWTHYDEYGRVDGYKKYSGLGEQDTTQSDTAQHIALIDVFGKSSLVDTTEKNTNMEIRFRNKVPKKHKFIWWDKWKNIEKKGLILATNPLAIFNGQLPFSLEYYIEARLGHEIGYTFLWDPLFVSRKKLDNNELLITGNDFFIRQKFYFKRNEHTGSPGPRPFEVLGYFGHELRYTSENYDFQTADSTNEITHFQANSWKIEWTPVLGARVLQSPDYPGITFDVVFGVGIGYQVFDQSFETTELTDNILEPVKHSGITIPIRVGFSFGYLF